MKQNFEFLKKSIPNLEKFSEIVLKWQKSLNLISKNTVSDIWNRHILDSAQLYLYLPADASVLVDIGSGAGFPGIVLAILNKELDGSVRQFYLIESDVKKCIFLNEVVRQLDLPVRVINERIEKISDIKADVLTARALADVPTLLKWSEQLRSTKTTCLFLKGESVDQEVEKLSSDFRIEKIQSLTDQKGIIIRIKGE